MRHGHYKSVFNYIQMKTIITQIKEEPRNKLDKKIESLEGNIIFIVTTSLLSMRQFQACHCL